MKRFRKVLFGGYRKEDVEEFVDSLLMQIEEAKKTAKELEEAARQAELRCEEAKEQVAKQSGNEEKQVACIRQMEEKLQEYESKYQAYAELLIEAKAQTQDYQLKAEQELKKQKEAYDAEFKKARRELDVYVEKINRPRQQLETVYLQLGNLLKTLPVTAEDVLGKDAVSSEEESSAEKMDSILRIAK